MESLKDTTLSDDITSSSRENTNKPRKIQRQIILVGALLIFALLIRLNLRQGEIWGNSMEPSYYHGTTVLIWKTAPRSSLRAGDVIIFKDDKGNELIKRIAFVRKQWQPQSPIGSYVHPNGGRLIPYSLLFDDYFQRVRSGRKPRPAPENIFYVLGDNLIDSDDSRSFGPIAPMQILGKVIP